MKYLESEPIGIGFVKTDNQDLSHRGYKIDDANFFAIRQAMFVMSHQNFIHFKKKKKEKKME